MLNFYGKENGSKILEGGACHDDDGIGIIMRVTISWHRGHERRYLFRFAKYRDMYRKHLFVATQRFNVSVPAYVVTSNHVHVLIATGDRGRPEVSEALQYVHGETGSTETRNVVDTNETCLAGVRSFFLRPRNLS